ncbi:MAG: stage 0 sporulation family protein [Firmicutes bacterium]|nr:stage 0 sporulation family protein [Bacillota bacterium]
MATVIGVRFKRPGKMYYFDPGKMEIAEGDTVVVETVRGVELGQCVSKPIEVKDEEIVPPLRNVVRIATNADVAQVERNRENEQKAYGICQEKIIAHKIEMKLVDVEYAFDASKIIFYFTANGRVDFRSLVKDLASVFKTRIELRQIGVRDEAKMLGGLGPCGRPICCGSFLGDFQPVSIKMAKEQNLSLNPTKISGLCGRLMCCLKYEQDYYEEARKKLPRVGKEVMTPDGRGHVVDLDVLRQTVKVRIFEGDSTELKEYAAEKIQRFTPPEADRRSGRHPAEGAAWAHGHSGLPEQEVEPEADEAEVEIEEISDAELLMLEDETEGL